MNKYVDELNEENGESVHYEEMVTGMEKPVATKHKRQSIAPLPSFSKIFVPIDQRTWNDILAVDHVNKISLSYGVSKTMTGILRHHGCHREDGGAIDWNTLVTCVLSRPRERLGLDDSRMVGSSSCRK